MHKLTKDRVALIRAMQHAATKLSTIPATSKLAWWDIIAAIRKDTDAYLSFSQQVPNRVSYAPKPDMRFADARTRTGLQRYVGRNFPDQAGQIDQRYLQRLCNAVVGRLTSVTIDGRITILRGDALLQGYRDALGGTSCMTGDCARFVRLYADHPDKVGMLVLDLNEHADYAKARALIWKTDAGETYIDRIYPNDGSHIDSIVEWAELNGYAIRPDHDCEWPSLDHTVTLKDEPPDNSPFPYADTFAYGTFEGDTLTLLTMYHDPDVSEDYTVNFDSTSGYHSGLTVCRECDSLIMRCDSVNVDGYYYCSACAESMGTCEQCISGTRTLTEVNTHEGNTINVCPNCITHHYIRCSSCTEFFSAVDVTISTDGYCYCDTHLIRCSECDAILTLEERPNGICTQEHRNETRTNTSSTEGTGDEGTGSEGTGTDMQATSEETTGDIREEECEEAVLSASDCF